MPALVPADTDDISETDTMITAPFGCDAYTMGV
jgi:hypothetical protein